MSNLRALFLTSSILLVACSANSADDDAVQGDDQNLTECDSGGAWAIRVDAPVEWSGTFILEGGKGTITNWLLSNRTQNGLTITDSAVLCGVETPDYKSKPALGGETFGLSFPEGAFAKTPPLTLAGSLSSKEIGASYSSPAAAALIGASMANPVSDAWPAKPNQVTSVDGDGDGKPGVSANMKTGPGYSNAPVNVSKSVRADRVYTAFRQVLSGTTGTVKSCNRVDGKGAISVIGSKAAIDNHVLGCRHAGDGADCSEGEYSLLDGAAPVYKPTGEATITMVKLPAGAANNCASVKSLDFNSAQ